MHSSRYVSTLANAISRRLCYASSTYFCKTFGALLEWLTLTLLPTSIRRICTYRYSLCRFHCTWFHPIIAWRDWPSLVRSTSVSLFSPSLDSLVWTQVWCLARWTFPFHCSKWRGPLARYSVSERHVLIQSQQMRWTSTSFIVIPCRIRLATYSSRWGDDSLKNSVCLPTESCDQGAVHLEVGIRGLEWTMYTQGGHSGCRRRPHRTFISLADTTVSYNSCEILYLLWCRFADVTIDSTLTVWCTMTSFQLLKLKIPTVYLTPNPPYNVSPSWSFGSMDWWLSAVCPPRDFLPRTDWIHFLARCFHYERLYGACVRINTNTHRSNFISVQLSYHH